jgi:hypothetical protein
LLKARCILLSEGPERSPKPENQLWKEAAIAQVRGQPSIHLPTIDGNGWKFAMMVELEEMSSIAANAAISSKLANLAKKENLNRMAKMTKLTFTYCFYMIKIT